MIKASEDWNGFNFFFENGWEVSIQQGEYHQCKAPYTVEVAIIDNFGGWHKYLSRINSLTSCEHDVNTYIGSDEVAKIMAIVQKMPKLGVDS